MVKIESLSFRHLRIPFNGEFAHARQTRRAGDTILVQIGCGRFSGWGEILARPYVTGECPERIMSAECESLAERLLGRELRNQSELSAWIDRELPRHDEHLALFGGVELGLWSLLAHSQTIDLDKLIGPRRTSQTGRCATIGIETPLEELRPRILLAHMQGATVVKLKVGSDPEADIARIHCIAGHLHGRIRLRLDGNACLLLEDAVSILDACADSCIDIESFEEPLQKEDGDWLQKLRYLHEECGVALVADESVCSLADLNACIGHRAFQVINLRLGKHGGLLGSRRIRDAARQAGLQLVAGSMVGESGILTHASEQFLSRSNELEYIEGLGQNRSWLTIDPVRHVSDRATESFRFEYRAQDCLDHVISERHFP